MSAKVQEYKAYNDMDVGLWSVYQEDFEDFDTDKFKKIGRASCRERV